MQIDPDWYFDDKSNQVFDRAGKVFSLAKLDISGDQLMDWCFSENLMEEPKVVALLICKILMGKHVGTESVIADLVTSFGYAVEDITLTKAENFILSKYGAEAVEEFKAYLHPENEVNNEL